MRIVYNSRFETVAPFCKLQDTTLPLDHPLVIDILALDRDEHERFIMSGQIRQRISRALVENVLSRRRVKIEPDTPLPRQIRRCGFAPDSQDLAFGNLISMPTASESIDPDHRFLATQAIAVDVVMHTACAADYSEHGNCRIIGSSSQDWEEIHDDAVPSPLPTNRSGALVPSTRCSNFTLCATR